MYVCSSMIDCSSRVCNRIRPRSGTAALHTLGATVVTTVVLLYCCTVVRLPADDEMSSAGRSGLFQFVSCRCWRAFGEQQGWDGYLGRYSSERREQKTKQNKNNNNNNNNNSNHNRRLVVFVAVRVF